MLSCLASLGSHFEKLSGFRVPKAQDDIIWRNPLFHQNIHYFPLSDVPEHPYLSLVEVKMKNHGEYVLVSLPTCL
jgi:hypothetical protein